MYDVYARVRADYNASTYYRLLLPLTQMHRLGCPVKLLLDQETIYMNPLHRQMAMASSEICMFYQSIGYELKHLMEQSRGTAPGKDKTGELHWPPSFIFTTDDDIMNVDPLNPAFQNMGYKDHTGKELEPGQKVWIRDLDTNEPILLWSDGENISYAKNKQCIDTWRDTMRMAELLVCSTPAVEQYVKREAPDTRTLVSPNCIDLSEYPKIELAEHPDEVRILWQGSTTHWRDLWDIRKPLAAVMKKYPHVRLVLWTGAAHQWVTNHLPATQLKWLDWMPYAQYKLRLNMMNHDINLAPLKETTFNKCRSGIKWYESAACWKPAPTLAEASTPYNEIEDGVTGLLYRSPEEFEMKLSGLVEDATLRATLASNAKDWIKTHRDPSGHALTLYEEFGKAREARKEWVVPRAAKRRAQKAAAKQDGTAGRAQRLKAVRKAG